MNGNNNNNNNNDTTVAAVAESCATTTTNDDLSNNGNHNKRTIMFRPRKKRQQQVVQLEEFLSLEVPHPYGVQPEGNRFLQLTNTSKATVVDNSSSNKNDAAVDGDATTPNESSKTSTATLTTTTSTTTMLLLSPTLLLTDECWNFILQYCNGIDLARIGQTCRYFYVASHLPELWRDLVLHKLHYHHTDDNASNTNTENDSDEKKNESKEMKNEKKQQEKVLEHFYHSWKDTFIRIYLSMDCNPQKAVQILEELHPHYPMMVAGIYSDFLYRLHTCRSFAIPQTWLNTTCCGGQKQQQQHDQDQQEPKNDEEQQQQDHNGQHQNDQDQHHQQDDDELEEGLVPRVSARDMTIQRFQDEYENSNFPLVIAGGAADWKATQQWNQLSYLLQMATITTTPPPPPPPCTTTNTSNNSNNGGGGGGSMASAIAAAAVITTAASSNTTSVSAADDGGGAVPIKPQQQMSFRATSGTAALPATFTLPAYLDYCETSVTNLMEEAPLYLFDRSSLIQPSSISSSSLAEKQEPIASSNQQEQVQSTASAPIAHYACFDDFRPCLARTCPYWDSQMSPQHDLFRLLGEGARPDHTWLIIGARRSGSVFHIDPNATHAWNATIVGRKRWIFYPPTTTTTGIFCTSNNDENADDEHIPPPGVHPSPDGDSVALPLSVGEWLQQFWPEHCRRMKQYSVKNQSRLQRKQQQDSSYKDTVQQQQQQHQHFLRPLECTTGPGDIVFVPHGWWHMVINLDEINIAITHNYVSGGSSYVDDGNSSGSNCNETKSGRTASAAASSSVNHGDHCDNGNKKHKNKHSNLPDVLRFLRDKRDQVSGCRDRPHEAIQPDCLYEEFVAALKCHYPEMLEAALEAVKEQDELEQKYQQAQGGKSRNMLDMRRRRHHHQERKKRQREIQDESTIASKKTSSATDDGQDASIMDKGKSQNENGNFSFSFF